MVTGKANARPAAEVKDSGGGGFRESGKELNEKVGSLALSEVRGVRVFLHKAQDTGPLVCRSALGSWASYPESQRFESSPPVKFTSCLNSWGGRAVLVSSIITDKPPLSRGSNPEQVHLTIRLQASKSSRCTHGVLQHHCKE